MQERRKFKLGQSGGQDLPGEFLARLHETLDTEQAKAAIDLKGHQLILAGAGSGKTRVLVWRVAALIASGVDSEKILLLTFTRKAAQEMLRRVEGVLGRGKQGVQGGTFHSWAARTLRRYGQSIGIQASFTIADSSDTEDLVSLLRTRMGFGGKERKFLQKSSLSRLFSLHANIGTPIEELVATEYPHAVEDCSDIQQLWLAFAKWKIEHQILDYDDLLVKALELLKTSEAILQELRQQHRYILVDEFQDTNRVQAEIVSLLAGDTGNLTVVGDECQSIYSFRGAEAENILQFPTTHPQSHLHLLTRNYRSLQPIIEVSNALMSSSKESFGKSLFAAQQKSQASLPILAHCTGFAEQAEFVAERTKQLCEEGFALSDIAVLFRSSSHSAELEIALARKNIPFRKYGGQRFIEAAHIKDHIALLRLVANPRDGISWQRVLQLIPGLGTAGIQAFLTDQDLCADPLQPLSDPKRISRKYGPSLQQLDLWIKKQSLDVAPTVLLEGARAMMEPWMELQYPDDWSKRKKELDTLSGISTQFPNLSDFLSELSLDPPDKTSQDAESDSEEGFLSLSTIHSAKGLEWRVIFVLSMLEGFLPSRQGSYRSSQLEEERRLFYVACTRAMQELYVCVPEQSFALSSQMDQIGIPSRFLDEIPQELWDHWEMES